MDNRWKIAFIVETLTLVLIMVGSIGFYLGKRAGQETGKFKMDSGPAVVVNETRPSRTSNLQPTIPPVLNAQTENTELTPTVAPSPSTTTNPGVIEAVYESTGYSRDIYTLSINQTIGNYVTGGIKQKDQAGREYYIAVKVNNAWNVVYYGEDVPACVDVDTYDFPIEMVPSCVDTSGTIVSR